MEASTVLWNDFAQRGIHEMAMKSKQITKAYYGKAAKVLVWTASPQAAPRPQSSPSCIPTILTASSAGARHQLDALHYQRAVPADRVPADLGGVPLRSGN